VRRVPHTRQAPRTLQAPDSRWLPGIWLVAAFIVASAALLAPGISYATASLASLSGPATAGCRGVTPAAFPALGFIANPARTQGGHLWWRRSAGDSVCIGTVVEWVQYNTTATKTWKVIVYSARHPHGQVVAHRTFALSRGKYFWSFGVHQSYPGLSAVCVTADDSFGVPCIHFDH
jgi:hypothetical protein